MKKIQVTESSMPSFEEYVNEIKDLWDSKWLTNMGSKHQALEKQLKDHLKVSNLALFSNGHLGLELAIDAFDFKKGGEVITTPFTFSSTTHAIVRNGLTPVFCDINPDDYTIDVTKIEELINDNTVAILPVHVYGNICDVEAIANIADKYALKVIYDAAHTFGVEYKEKGIGAYGDASMFSFHATKVYNTIEGGAVSFKNESFYTHLESLKNFGTDSQGNINYVGANAKMNEFQAAMGLCNLKNVDKHIERRKEIVAEYNHYLGNTSGLKVNESQANVKSNYSYYPLVFEDYKYTRDEVEDELANENIFARKYFYPLTSDFEVYKNKYKGQTPVASKIAANVLTLPLHPYLKSEDIRRICQIITD